MKNKTTLLHQVLSETRNTFVFPEHVCSVSTDGLLLVDFCCGSLQPVNGLHERPLNLSLGCVQFASTANVTSLPQKVEVRVMHWFLGWEKCYAGNLTLWIPSPLSCLYLLISTFSQNLPLQRNLRNHSTAARAFTVRTYCAFCFAPARTLKLSRTQS